MMKSTGRLLLAVCCIALGHANQAQADGWFGKSQPAAANGTTTSGKSGWSSWMPWSSSASQTPKSNKPSVFSNMAKGTKSAWNKTTSFLNPFDNPPKQPPKSTSDRRTGDWFSGTSTNLKPNEDGKVTSVNDWLAGERPKF